MTPVYEVLIACVLFEGQWFKSGSSVCVSQKETKRDSSRCDQVEFQQIPREQRRRTCEQIWSEDGSKRHPTRH